jgi:hypothetical protein
MNTISFKTSVLFLTFNRLDTAKEVFYKIQEIKPLKLYLASDGPRFNVEGENQIVEEVRDWILNNINWDCEVKTLFRDKNLGCKKAVSEAINWFFRYEEEGIILEDDVVPSRSFFEFCSTLLERYRSDQRIMMIGGTNYFLDTKGNLAEDYFYSQQYSIWGWATWRRAWTLYDVDMDSWRTSIHPRDLNFFSCIKSVNKYWEYNFDLVKNSKIDTWDIQWVYTCLSNYGLTAIPHKNLISNIGLKGAHADGTVTDSHFLQTFDYCEGSYLNSPQGVFPNISYDLTLHRQKTVKAYRAIVILNIIKAMGVYEFLRKIKRKIKAFK